MDSRGADEAESTGKGAVGFAQVLVAPAGEEDGGWPRGDVHRDILEPKAIKARNGLKHPALGSL